MAAKFFIILSLACAASALPVLQYEHAEPQEPAHYEFAYSVQDGHSGDVKEQQESRAGDAVHGSYSLVQPDGVRRVVHYTADKEQGFNAVVSYEGHPTEGPTKIAYAAPKIAYATAPVAKIAYAAPQYSYAAPQISYAAAPVHKIAYSAPVAKLAYAAQPLAHVSYSSPAISYHH